MTHRSLARLAAMLCLLILGLLGCNAGQEQGKPVAVGEKEGAGEEAKPGESEKPPSAQAKAELAKTDGAKKAEGEKQEPETAELQPFTPPTMAELDAKAEWIEQPVVDFMERLKAELAKEKPEISVAEALKLRNDSKETNAKILSALGRLPAEDSEADWNATINRHSGGEVKNTNPIMMSTTAEFDVAGLIGFGLFGAGPDMVTVGSNESVKSWQTSKDHLVDKFVLRDDLLWSDGKPITAHDIVFSFRTIMNPKVPVPAQRNGTDKLRWVEAYDDHTVVFFHKEALATNVENMSFSIIPKHVYEKSIDDDPTLANSEYHVKLQNNPVVGGSYIVASRVQGQEMVLERRESSYMFEGKQVRPKPYFKTVRFRFMPDSNTALLALKKGDIDELILQPSQWITQTGGDEFYDRNTKVTGVEWTYFYFGWNLKSPFFSDVRVRKAMSSAYNYDELLKTLCYGLYEPCNGIWYPTSWMAPKTKLPYYKQDLSRAETLLDEAGWTDHDGDGWRDKKIDGQFKKFEFTILCSNIPERVAICELLHQNLDEIGVVCNVQPLEFAVLQEKVMNKDFDAEFGGWGSGTDPDTAENIWGTKEMRNFVSYSNPEVDKLFAAGRKEFDRQKRAEIYARIDELIYADQPYTFLYVRNGFYGFDKSLRGYRLSPRGPYHYSPGFSSIWKVQ